VRVGCGLGDDDAPSDAGSIASSVRSMISISLRLRGEELRSSRLDGGSGEDPDAVKTWDLLSGRAEDGNWDKCLDKRRSAGGNSAGGNSAAGKIKMGRGSKLRCVKGAEGVVGSLAEVEGVAGSLGEQLRALWVLGLLEEAEGDQGG